ncbi:MAG: gliding motility-associated C-terminal domain-containing protein [Bacteroidota bacterium]|nr:gliding motility-associated C-terminal domain-containing protein [Bacteroidota bacterium]
MTKLLNISILLLFVLTLFSTSAKAQKEGAIWYFGYNAGLDFTRHYPKPITDGQIYTREGVATISTSEGDLLFYTDGGTVWNKNHQVMNNGFGLFGSVTSTQSSIIVPTPNKQYEYYIFTVDVVEDDGVPGKGLNWSLVDMIQSNRLGRVFPKNQQLLDNCVEKITVVKHDNDVDYWIIAHGWNNNKFYVYKLTSTGVVPAKAGMDQQSVGAIHENTDPNDDFNRGAVGYMKASPKGDMLALAVESKAIFELFSFDSKTGEIKLLANLPAGEPGYEDEAIHAAYGVEFSPTSNYLYGSTRKGGKLYRWDITLDNQVKIRNSLEVINSEMSNITCGAIQLAFNGKIYVCFAGKQYLGVINSPTQEDCKFTQQGASLIDNIEGVGGKAYYGLPTFLPDFFKAAEFYFDNTCQHDTTLFYLSTTFFLGSDPSWTITTLQGDLVGKAVVNSQTKEGTWVFQNPGEYIVELKVLQNGAEVTQRREITIHALPELNFTDTTVLCATKTVILDAGDGAFYKWSDNVNLLERYRSIAREGIFSVRVIHNNGCVKFDTTTVVEKPLPKLLEIINVKASCGYNNGSITIIPEKELSEYSFVWKEYPDSTGNTLANLGRGIYEVDIISEETGCALTERITISETGAPPVEIKASVEGIICPGTEIILTAEGAQNYLWSYPEGEISRQVKVYPYSTTTYIVEGYSADGEGNRCSGFDEITVEVHPYQPPELGSDREVCEGEEVKLDGGELYVSWNWNTGDTDRYLTVIEDYLQPIILEVEDQKGCLLGDTVSITFKPLPVVDLGSDKTICKGEPITLDAGVAEEYIWNTGATEQTIQINTTGHYSVLVTSDGCSGSDDIIIQINSPDSLKIDSVNVKDITCYGANDGNILVFSRGEGSFYEFSLDDGASWTANSGYFNAIPPGENYTVQVREDSACTKSWGQEVAVYEPDELLIDYRLVSPSCDNCQDGQIKLKLSGGTQPYDILWANFETGKNRSGLFLGEYSVSITDAAFCKSMTTINLEMGHGSVSIPNAFTPNGDDINDTWIISALEEYPEAIVTVFDRTGKVVFESAIGYPEPWDGKYNGDLLSLGTYYFVIKLNDLLDLVNGSLTIIR